MICKFSKSDLLYFNPGSDRVVGEFKGGDENYLRIVLDHMRNVILQISTSTQGKRLAVFSAADTVDILVVEECFSASKIVDFDTNGAYWQTMYFARPIQYEFTKKYAEMTDSMVMQLFFGIDGQGNYCTGYIEVT